MTKGSRVLWINPTKVISDIKTRESSVAGSYTKGAYAVKFNVILLRGRHGFEVKDCTSAMACILIRDGVPVTVLPLPVNNQISEMNGRTGF